MNYRFDLISPLPASSVLVEHLNSEIMLTGSQRQVPLGDHLGNILASSIFTPSGVTAVSVFCWDEGGEFGDFRQEPPPIWLLRELSDQWKAEGYGFTVSNARVVRWISWIDPEDSADSATVYEAISATHKMRDHMKGLDGELARHLVNKDPNASNAAAFIVTVAADLQQASSVMDHIKSTVYGHLQDCKV